MIFVGVGNVQIQLFPIIPRDQAWFPILNKDTNHKRYKDKRQRRIFPTIFSGNTGTGKGKWALTQACMDAQSHTTNVHIFIHTHLVIQILTFCKTNSLSLDSVFPFLMLSQTLFIFFKNELGPRAETKATK